jgi:uncharacterized heparinase superfamily protein
MDHVMSNLEDRLLQMWRWLQTMCHPDGQIALFNDAAHNVYLSPRSLSSYLSRLVTPESDFVSGSFALADSGYYGWSGTDGEYVVCDAGAIGPDYQPGHAHADLFSFELSLNGRRMIVDSGTSTYSAGSERDYLRSTAAHNTVEVNRRSQVEVWSAFRVGRRVKPCDVEFTSEPDGFTLSGAHDGYKRDFGIRHRRTFVFHRNRGLRITDTLEGASNQRIASRLHFAPGCSLIAGNGGYVIRNQETEFGVMFDGYASPHVEESFVSYDMGKRETAMSLVLTLPEGTNTGNIRIVW